MKIYRNWCQGRYSERIFCYRKFFHPATLHLERQWLYTTHGGQLRKLRRLKKGILDHRPDWTIGDVRQSDITCFVKKNDVIFVGRQDGRIFTASSNALEDDEIMEEIAADDLRDRTHISSVDFDGDLFVTTTRVSTKIWRKTIELGVTYMEQICDALEGQKSVRISLDGKSCAMGKYNERKRKALRMFDLET